jgi:hypothetical protein
MAATICNPKNCKFCDKKDFRFLPLLYAAVGADQPSALMALPALSGKLGAGVIDLPLTHARYAVRIVREGYLYVLIEREGVKYWQAYQVVPDSFLFQFTADDPPQRVTPFTCERTGLGGVNGSVVNIPDAKTVPNIWVLFTPDPLTKAKLDEIKLDPAGWVSKQVMQHFSPAQWVNGNRAQQHSLQAEELFAQAAEFILFKQAGNASQLGQVMERQLFPACKDAYAGAPADDKGEYSGRLGGIYNLLKQQQYGAFVLPDAIGITQSLNDFRNAPLEGLQRYLAATDEYGATNQHRLEVYEAIQEIQSGMLAGVIGDAQAGIDEHRSMSDRYYERNLEAANAARRAGDIDRANDIEAEMALQQANREKNYQAALDHARNHGGERWKNKYENRLDTEEIKTFDDTFTQRSESAFDKATQRAQDHIQWFEAPRLVSAFDVYDSKNTASNNFFAIATSICSMGMASCKQGEDKLDAWITAPVVSRSNLYMRGFYYNQDELIKAAQQAFAEIKTHAEKVELASEITGPWRLRRLKI